MATLITPGGRTQGGMDRVLMVDDAEMRDLFLAWRLNKMHYKALCGQCSKPLNRGCIKNCPGFLGDGIMIRSGFCLDCAITSDGQNDAMDSKLETKPSTSQARCRGCGDVLEDSATSRSTIPQRFIPRDLVPTAAQARLGLSSVDIALNKQRWTEAFALIEPLLEKSNSGPLIERDRP